MSDPAPPEPPIANLWRCQVVFSDYSNMPENRYINTLHFYHAPPVVEANVIAMNAVVRHFYETITEAPFNVAVVGEYLASYINRTYQLKWYDMGLPVNERLPYVYEGTLATANATTGLPAEVALCCSWRGVGVQNPRTRGRLYLGPLTTAASSGGSATAYPRPASTLRSGMAGAAKRLVTETQALGEGIDLVIYSRTNDDVVPVAQGFVDDAFDTQRRRGQAASTRTIWTM